MKKLFTFILFLISPLCWTKDFTIQSGSDLVGELGNTSVAQGETFADIARRTNIGFIELIEANPDIHPWRALPGTSVTLPSRYVLPPGPRKGIVINLPELRLYYYHPDGKKVSTYPIAIGKEGWLTPVANTRILEKTIDPSWTVPQSILNEKRRSGINNFPTVVPAGPKNPLGKYAIRLSLDSYLIHGTNLNGGIGSRVSHGCIRLSPQDIEDLFHQVSVGTPVRIINEPIKIGRGPDRQLYVEAHLPLKEFEDKPYPLHQSVQQALNYLAPVGYNVDWNLIDAIGKRKSGIPKPIGETPISYEQRNWPDHPPSLPQSNQSFVLEEGF